MENHHEVTKKSFYFLAPPGEYFRFIVVLILISNIQNPSFDDGKFSICIGLKYKTLALSGRAFKKKKAEGVINDNFSVLTQRCIDPRLICWA